MARTVATTRRAAVLCWLVMTSGRVCGGEVTAEDVDELLADPKYVVLKEQLTELLTKVTEGIELYEKEEAESEDAWAMCGAAARRAAPEPCTCDQVEIRGSAEVKQLQPACLGRYTRTEVSWSDNPVFVNDEDDGLFLFVFDGDWVVGWRDACSGDFSHSRLITQDGHHYDDKEDYEDEDEDRSPSSTCPSDGDDWRVRNETDLSWNRLPLSVVCSDEPLEHPPECCERVRVSAGGAGGTYDGVYESALEPSAGHRRVYWNAAESLLLTYRKSGSRWSVLPKNGPSGRLEMNDDSKGLPCPSDPDARWDEGDSALVPPEDGALPRPGLSA